MDTKDTNDIKQELYKYLISFEDTKIGNNGCYINTCYIYKNLFKSPVERIFYWEEESFQGTVYVLYKYKNYYVSVIGFFGSCEGCDYIQGTKDIETLILKTNHIFDTKIDIYTDINDIVLSKYAHCDLQKELYDFLEGLHI